jgi:hypothetical protein
MSESEKNKEKRNIFIRVFLSIFWLIVTVILLSSIIGAVVGVMSAGDINTTGMSISQSAEAGAQLGGKNSTEFMVEHLGKVILSGLAIWMFFSIKGLFPGISKYKK